MRRLVAEHAKQWWKQRPERLKQFYEMMGLSDLLEKRKRPSPEPVVTSVLERDGYRIENLYFRSMPRLYVAGNLYVPTNGMASVCPPCCIFADTARLQGITTRPTCDGSRSSASSHSRLIRSLGESNGFHHGPFREGWWHWYSRGYTPAASSCLTRSEPLIYYSRFLCGWRPDWRHRHIGAAQLAGGLLPAMKELHVLRRSARQERLPARSSTAQLTVKRLHVSD